MIHTEKQIIEIAIKAMNDIDWGFDESKKLNAVFNSKEEAIEDIYKYATKELLENPNFEDYINSQKPDYWFVGFKFEPEAELETNSIFLDIWDATGEPFYIRHRQAGFNILKDENGKYYKEKKWNW